MCRWLVCGTVVALGWLLVTPPYGALPPWDRSEVGCGDPGHTSPCMPLIFWRELGRFDAADACGAARDAGIVASTSDVEWARWQMARCFSAERVRSGPNLQPGE